MGNNARAYDANMSVVECDDSIMIREIISSDAARLPTCDLDVDLLT